MSEQHVKLGDFKKVLRAEMKALKARVNKAVVNTAKVGAEVCKSFVPSQFSEIAPGIKAIKDGNATVIRSHAPHSRAVEVGPGFHHVAMTTKGGGRGTFTTPNGQVFAGMGVMPDLGTLIAWIRQYGSGRGGGETGKSVRAMLKAIPVPKQPRRKRKAFAPEVMKVHHDPAVALACILVNSLKKHNKPHRFMQSALPAIWRTLDDNIQNAMTEKVSLSDAAAALAGSSSIGAGGAIGSGRRRLGATARKLAKRSGGKAS